MHGQSVSVYSIRTVPLNDTCVLTMALNRMYEENCLKTTTAINNTLQNKSGNCLSVNSEA